MKFNICYLPNVWIILEMLIFSWQGIFLQWFVPEMLLKTMSPFKTFCLRNILKKYMRLRNEPLLIHKQPCCFCWEIINFFSIKFLNGKTEGFNWKFSCSTVFSNKFYMNLLKAAINPAIYDYLLKFFLWTKLPDWSNL